MSRSKRKYLAGGNAVANSDQPWKRESFRSWRRACRMALKSGEELPHEREYREPWKWPKDGKGYWGDIAWKFDEEWKRKILAK